MARRRWLALAFSLVLLGSEQAVLALELKGTSPGVGAPKRRACRGRGKKRRACMRAALDRPGGDRPGPGFIPDDGRGPGGGGGGGGRGGVVEQCDPPEAGLVATCLRGDAHVDEIETWLFNTVLVRGCGRFVIHHRSGNALLGVRATCPAQDDLPGPNGARVGCPVERVPDLEHVLDRDIDAGGTFDFPEEPGFRDRQFPALGGEQPDEPAWVLALRGCGLDKVRQVTVSGDGVSATLVSPNAIVGWPVPLSSQASGSSSPIRIETPKGFGRDTLSTAFVRFEAAAGAEPVTRRQITVHFADGGSQVLDAVELVVARNGDVDTIEPAEVRWEDRPPFTLRGQHLGNAALVPRPCVRNPQVVLNPEDRLIVSATLYCPREVADPWQPEHVSVVNDPSCRCSLAAYDDLLSVYHELPKAPFSYGASVEVGPNLEYLAEHPAVVGDSLSQGFYGGAIKPDTQRWAYPQVVATQMGSASRIEQNLIRIGPGVEDAVKTLLPHLFGLPPDAVNVLDPPQGENVELAVGTGVTTDQPAHTGIAGMDYTNVLRTSGRCLDTQATADDPVVLRDPPDGDSSLRYDQRLATVCSDGDVECCAPDPECHAPRPWLDVQLGLACSRRTPIEMMELTRPTFVFASAGANHFLACATHTKVDECIELDRFYRDSAEVFRRLRRIDTVRGGVVFGVPPLSRIDFLVEDAAGAGRHAFWKRADEIDGAAELLDASEMARLTAMIDEANAHLARLASLNGYAFVNSTEVFDRLHNVGVPIVDPSTGTQICRVGPHVPTLTLERDPFPGADAGCGMVGLDAIHPGRLGHSIMANEIIRGINAHYDVDIPVIGGAALFALWQADSLNQDPVDIRAFLSGEPPTACLAAVVEFQVAMSTAPACALTFGALCPVTLAAAVSGAADLAECHEALIREAVRDSFKKIDREPEPKICWGGADGGVCHFAQ